MTKASAPTMKDVAKEAGVALGTVSKVINGIPVGEEYKIKVERAIEKLNYQVNTYARGLKTSKTETITLIIPSLNHPFYSSFAYEVEQQAYAHGRKLILCCSNGIPEKELDYLLLASKSKTDGIIAITYADISKQVPDHIPLIALDRQFENHQISRIASDNYEGGLLAMQKLIEFGCKKPVFVGFHSPFPGEADKRFDAFLAFCQKHRIPPVYLYAYGSKDPTESIINFIKEHEDHQNHQLLFDGIFANTDLDAYIIIQILNSMGYFVPKDVQIIGFDGIKKLYPFDEYLVSTIRQPIDEIAKKCLDILLDDKSNTRPTLTLLPVTYEYGGTTIS